MSERTSLSSEGFHTSLLNLAMEFPAMPSFDVDELFARDEVRQRLVEKLLGSKAERPPTGSEAAAALAAAEALEAAAAASARELFPTEAESLGAGEAEALLEEEGSEWAAAAAAVRRLSSAGAGEPAGPSFVPWRVFVNCVDTFNGRHVARLLAERALGEEAVPGAGEGGAGGEEEEQRGEAEFLGEEEGEGEGEEGERPQRATRRILFPRTNLEIFGSLLRPGAKYDTEVVAQIVPTEDKVQLIKILKTCGFIVYDVSRHDSQIREARWILQTLQYELMLMERWDPDRFTILVDVPVFILVSPFLTWARTRPPGPFTDADFKKRRPHPKYKDHFKLEKETLAAGKVYPRKYRTAVLCSGVTYGFDEDVLDFLFRYGWENEPALPVYSSPKSCIPLVHVQDLATMIFNVMENFPKKRRYMLAVERGKTNVKKLTRAISKGLSTGEIVFLPSDEMKFLRLSQHINDCMLANVNLQPEYFADPEKMTWASESPFIPNIANIIKEYLKYRNLGAKRILIVGPPGAGKTTLAKKLCGYYRLHYLSPDYVAQRHIKNLQDKVERLQAKESAAQERELAREAQEEEGEEDEEEEEEEEEEVGEEDEEPETIESLREQVDALKNNLKENAGKLDEENLMAAARRLLATPPLRNQGYVLDGFPSNVRQMRLLFRSAPVVAEGEEAEELGGGGGGGGEDEEDEEPPEDVQPLPDYVIGLEAPDDFLLLRAQEQPAGVPGYGEEEFKARLAAFREANPEEGGVLSYVDERDVHPMVHPVEGDEGLERTAAAVERRVGRPQNLGLSAEEEERQRALQEELGAQEGAAAAEAAEAAATEAHRARMRRLEQWALTVDALRREEEQLEEAQGLALRHYLMRFVLPTLARALLEAERVRPLDPLDFLAEFLFRENPEGLLGEPEHSAASRRFFHDLLKCREPLLRLAQLSPKEEEIFFPKDVLENPEQEYDTFY